MTREKELEKVLRRLRDALWKWDMPFDPPRAVNDAYIAAGNLLAEIASERLSNSKAKRVKATPSVSVIAREEDKAEKAG